MLWIPYLQGRCQSLLPSLLYNQRSVLQLYTSDLTSGAGDSKGQYAQLFFPLSFSLGPWPAGTVVGEVALLTLVKAVLVIVAVAVPLEFAAEVTVGQTMLTGVSSLGQF